MNSQDVVRLTPLGSRMPAIISLFREDSDFSFFLILFYSWHAHGVAPANALNKDESGIKAPTDVA